MIDFTKVKVGTKVKYACKQSGKAPRKCKVIDIIKAYQLPDQLKVIKYYGVDVIQPKYGRVFGPITSDRIILKRRKKDYIVIPVTHMFSRWCHLEILEY